MALQKIHKDYMWYLLKHFKLILTIICISDYSFAQKIIKTFSKDSLSIYLPKSSTIENKTIPKDYNDAIIIALQYYPKLAKTKIKFKVKNQLAPLSARPTIWSTFVKPHKRKYIICISDKSIEKLNPILLKNLSFNAQIGVIGHELSHISEYNSKKGAFFIRLAFKHFLKKKMDLFEFNTDMRCIEHGLGYQLLSWSEEVREKLSLTKWGGANEPKREKYMNPNTIKQSISCILIYK